MRSVLVVLAAMLVLFLVQWASDRSLLASTAMKGIWAFVSITLGVIITLFVYRDARERGMAPAAVWMWTALIFLSNFVVPGSGFLSLLVYLLVTRSGR
jgi:NhaP-type Na+/H+ and K+/H+ antiporter